ncbi:glycosyltransferase family 4 protein [Kitasatospora purpeofusca]|uniref:glycosyltransferase family 4 protein n=1 Tax=Kitasatospora purpeofusca TaxID=67352 RepID=UPI002E1510C1|nr:glycosyltransferase family 4 protein [Kitasatospora purpeofusca]WSR35716.1 glycosyltransferase family 4 protein [Kitasatospora purpeofusca]WSR44023.1 glycosyltransferase family 4 protein [Kitasatospora purpeofusca]
MLYVIDSVSRVGGAEQGLVAMTPQLVRAGVKLDVAYLKDSPGGFQPELTSAGADVFGVGRASRGGTVAALHRLVRERRPDLVHTTLYESDVLGRAAALAARTPVVTSLVNAAYGPEHRNARGLNPWKVRAAQAVDATTAQGTRRFHALTRYVAGAMARRLRVPSQRIDVVPRGRDPELLGSVTPDRRAAVRTALELPQDVPVVLAAARQQYQKGLDVLLEAWPEVLRAEPDAVLLLAGSEGGESERLRALAAATRGVRFLGPRDDVFDLMAASDAFAVPSRWEGLGSAAMEAMGVGVPLVAADVPALRETVGSEDYARLVAPEHPAALAAALTDTLEDRASARMRAKAARARFLTSFTLHQVSAQMVEFYERSLRLRTV